MSSVRHHASNRAQAGGTSHGLNEEQLSGARFDARERELEEFLEHGRDPMQTLAADGTVLWANEAQLSLVGRRAEEYVGQNVRDFFREPWRADAMILEIAIAGQASVHSAELQCASGGFKKVTLQARGCGEDGELVRIRCMARDTSANEPPKPVQDEFLAMLGHELRNPLAPIQMAVQLLRRPSEHSARHLDVIDRQVENLNRLVHDLVDVSRVTRGKIQLRKRSVDIGTIVRRAVDSTTPLMEQRRHQVSVSLPDEALRVYADPIRLEQVFVNLLINAAKYTDPGGHVSISVGKTDEWVDVSVRDNGVGLDNEMRESVFDLFRQAKRGRDRAQGGLGVGLTIARKLVELHHGSIHASSPGLGQGADFLVRLKPWHDSGSERGDTRQARPMRDEERNVRVLIVDDNVDIADTLAEFLQMDLPGETRAAYDGVMALELAQSFKPDIVLLDIGLPGMDGYELALRLREAGNHAVLIAVTGYGQEKDRERSKSSGFMTHLVKPVQLDVLMNALEAAQAELRRDANST